jgi:hypothetical protein
MSLVVANGAQDPRHTKLGAELVHARTAKSKVHTRQMQERGTAKLINGATS